MVERLKEDHENADYLGKRLEEIDGLKIDFNRRDINMVFFTLSSGIIKEEVLVEKLHNENIFINGIEDGEYRFVTNIGVDKDDIDELIDKMKRIIG